MSNHTETASATSQRDRGTNAAAVEGHATPAHDIDLTGPVDLHDPLVRQHVEASLRAVPGILAVRLVPGFDREVDELHAVTTLDKSAKQAARDLQSMLMASFGISTDHRVISVVQLRDTDTDASPRTRVVIDRVAVSQKGLAAQVSVTVNDGEEALEGQSEGPASAAGRRRATARATLASILPLLGNERVVEVEGVEVQDVLGHLVAITFVHFHTPQGEDTVCGSAMVRGDESDAIARAVLDAVNRAIEVGDLRVNRPQMATRN